MITKNDKYILTALFALMFALITPSVRYLELLQDITAEPTTVTMPHKEVVVVVDEKKDISPETIWLLSEKTYPDDWVSYYVSISHCANNNPGNLEYRGQPNSVKCGRWACFDTIRHGVRGLVKQLEADINRGDTLREFLEDYAPSHENRTEDYILFVGDMTGLKEHEWIGACDFILLLKTIIKKEC